MSLRTYRPRTKARVGNRPTTTYSSSLKMVEYNYLNSQSSSLKSTRKKEKQEMQDLNARLAHYIEVSRYNDALNKDLLEEIENLRSESGNDSIKKMYETEMGQLRKLLDEAELEKAELKSQVGMRDSELGDLREEYSQLESINDDNLLRIARQDDDLSACESQLASLQRRCNNLEGDRDRDRNNLDRLKSEVSSLRNELAAETVNRIDNQNQCQTLKEEIEFMKDVHSQELKEFSLRRNPLGKTREWWSNEFSSCIKEIQEEYDSRLKSIRDEMDDCYNIRMHEIQSETLRNDLESAQFRDRFSTIQSANWEMKNHVAKLENENQLLTEQNEQLQRQVGSLQLDYDRLLVEKDAEMGEIRAHLESTLSQLQSLTDTNMSLQLEIIAYRKLLEGEESRMGIRDESHYKTSDEETSILYDSSHCFHKGDPSKKTTYQRSAKGPVTITSVQPTHIQLENTNISNNEDLSGWKMIQFSDDQIFEFCFDNFLLQGGQSVKICANGYSHTQPNDLVWVDRTSLSTGSVVTTSLLNSDGDEKATYTQKTIFIP